VGARRAWVGGLGVGDRASDALLNMCLAVGGRLRPLLTGAGERDAGALTDQLPRLQAVLVCGPAAGRDGALHELRGVGLDHCIGRCAPRQPAECCMSAIGPNKLHPSVAGCCCPAG